MVLETIEICFLTARSDVSHPMLLTSECNEHTFGGWRNIQREFTVLEVTEIEEKRRVKMDAVHKSDLTLVRDKSSVKGYQATFHEFLKST